MGRARRNDPWWMREEEKNNPRVLPEYTPWWADGRSCAVDISCFSTVAQLKAEATRRELVFPTASKKAELQDLLRQSNEQYGLSDANFLYPEYTPRPKTTPPCYPESYEGVEGIESLRKKSFMTMPPK